MASKLININGPLGRAAFIAAALGTVALATVSIRWNFVSAVVSRIDPERPEARPIAEWVAGLAPDDPTARFAAAVIFERSFDEADRALAEYEAAAHLSPHHYFIWLGLARARNAAGDATGAEAAFERAQDLAPNYSVVQWTYGNFLIREGRSDEGFPLIARAAAADQKYGRPAVATAMQVFDGDIARVRAVLGDTPSTNVAIALVLSSQGRFDDVLDAWRRVPAPERAGRFAPGGTELLDQALSAKKFRLAAKLAADQTGRELNVGEVANGGFETDIKLRKAPLFEWQIAEGSEPQIGRSNSRPQSGGYSLMLVFNTFETAAFRSIDQTITVEPGARYQFEVHYRSDLRTPAEFRWEVADAGSLTPLTATPPMTAADEWTALRATVAVPADTDGVTIRLTRTGCTGPSCPVSGRIWFDDISLTRIQ